MAEPNSVCASRRSVSKPPGRLFDVVRRIMRRLFWLALAAIAVVGMSRMLTPQDMQPTFGVRLRSLVSPF